MVDLLWANIVTMRPIALAIIVSMLAIGAILAATYRVFFALAAHFPPGRTLGMIGAALMLGSGLGCIAVGYLANQWVRQRRDANEEAD